METYSIPVHCDIIGHQHEPVGFLLQALCLVCCHFATALTLQWHKQKLHAGMQQQQRQPPAIEHTLPCTLQELYLGGTKKMKVSRTIHNAAGRPERISEILSIEIKPGWKKGTKITFPEKGDTSHAITTMHFLRSCRRFPYVLCLSACP